jgi:hypothetical protein
MESQTHRRQVKVSSTAAAPAANPGKAVRDAVMNKHQEVQQPTELGDGQLQLTLRNGTQVIMGPPKTGIMIAIAQIMADAPENTMLFMLVRAIMYIRSISGTPIALPQNMVDVKVICNMLGPDGEDEVIMAYARYWPPITDADLNIIKK